MSAMLDLYLARADEAAAEAEAATLDNVRDRCLRSQAAWQAMAERQEWIEEQRRLRENKTAVDVEIDPFG
jgi:hypothetical protein